MELRVLKYFVTVAEEGNFSSAARKLNITQPTLSRQIQELEEELGAKLLERGGRGARLTEDGEYFKRKAKEILALANNAREEIILSKKDISGEVFIAGGETRAMRYVAAAIKKARESHPGVIYHFLSGNAEDTLEWIEKDQASFGLFVMPANLRDLDYVRLPYQDTWGVLLRKDDPLAKKKKINPENLTGRNLICSRQELVDNEFAGWFGKSLQQINIVATYNLLYNASLLVEQGVGVALGLDGIINIDNDSPICFKELEPALKVDLALAWKRDKAFSQAEKVFKEYFDREIALTASLLGKE